MVAQTRATKALALVGVGILLLFIGYLGWQDQVCNDFNRSSGLGGPCGSFAYPWRGTYILGLAFFLGFTFVIMGLILLAKIERTDGRSAVSNRAQDNQVSVDW